MGKIQELVTQEELNLLRRLRQLQNLRDYGILLIEWDRKSGTLTWRIAGEREPKRE